ncbi:helix-turn-helix domain-containing protein [Paenibacillus sp. IITD108]|uniref:helix-turn-helix domain-containing protein n=1 Tax=Paenibacillus sp. IITD108 TaxID=3116649 RepID=UPI002F4235EC
MRSDNALNNIFLPRSKGECIRIIRQRLGYTQSRVAEEAGLSREQVSKMETQFLNVSDKLWDYALYHAYKNLYLQDDKTCSFDQFKDAINCLVKEKSELE